jgi:hypothetical protein
MEIPESISKLTVEGAGDRFAITQQAPQLSIDDIVILLKQQLSLQNYKAFEEGLAYHKKDPKSEKNFIKNLFFLYNDVMVKSIQTSNISDEIKNDVVTTFISIVNNTMQSIDAIYTLTGTLNNNKNIIDVQKILYIILGYVIDTIKRNNNTSN